MANVSDADSGARPYLERFSPAFTAHGHVKRLPAKEN
jgi:hypothetical protein